ncbi:hypothetical protein SAMN05216431_1216 [Ligilactobacillus sp. WC1T17]|uniref:Holin-like toxin n=1 Tax=Ligilactobacillus ruminis TaxID=1623 RepID=A0ABY1AEZ1_9LACO|nr:hypothetical protein SAMN05216431_1216 [Ligilactobacillus ruminis]
MKQNKKLTLEDKLTIISIALQVISIIISLIK